MSTSHPTYPSLAPSRIRALTLLVAVFAFFFAAYTFTQSGDIFSTGDTTIRIQIAENILGRLSWDLHGWHLQFPHHLKKEFLDPRVSKCSQGRTCSTYLLGQPLAIIPFDKLGSALAVHLRWPYGVTVAWFARLVGPLFGALEVALFFVFAMRLGYGLRRSLLLTAVFGFATSVWPDEQSVLEHTEVAFFLLLAFYLAFRYREQHRNWPYLIYSGAALGGAAITRYQDAFLGAVALGIYLILPRGPDRTLLQRARSVVLFGIGLLPFVAVDLWYNWIRFGSVFATGHYETLFGEPITTGAAGLLVSPGKGLLWYCPVIFLLVFAGPRFYRRYPMFSLASLAVFAGFVLLYANVTFWHGDPTWGPRYLYPTIPFFTLPLGEILGIRTRYSHGIWAISALVVAASFTIQFSAVSVSQWRTWYKVIQYEGRQGHPWEWIAARYRYFWDPHESPLYFQLHGLYQMTYDTLLQSNKYEIVPPDENPTLDGVTTDFAINQWNFWWASNEFDWWMGERKIMLGMTALVSIMLAAGVYLTAEAAGGFAREPARSPEVPIPEAA